MACVEAIRINVDPLLLHVCEHRFLPLGEAGSVIFTYYFLVALTSVSATSTSGSDSLTSNGFAEAALLDSGTSYTLLPTDIARSILDEVGATVVFAVVPCALTRKDGTISYTFGRPNGVTIKVPASSLVSPVSPEANALFGGPPTYPDGPLDWLLGV